MRSAGDLACPAMPEILRQRNLTKATTATQPGNSMTHLRLIEFAKPSRTEHRPARGYPDTNQAKARRLLCFQTALI
jgi:ribosomal protein L34E